MPTYVTAEIHPGCWKLPKNDLYDLPAEDQHFELEHAEGYHRPIIRLRALCVGRDGRIYGMRTMYHPREDGYCMRGRVSVGGRKVRAFTGSLLFEREDGTLVNVACCWVPAEAG